MSGLATVIRSGFVVPGLSALGFFHSSLLKLTLQGTHTNGHILTICFQPDPNTHYLKEEHKLPRHVKRKINRKKDTKPNNIYYMMKNYYNRKTNVLK